MASVLSHTTISVSPGPSAAFSDRDASLLGQVVDIIRICRLRHWSKNVFLLAPLLFSGTFTPEALVAAAMAFACFGAWTSAGYCLNDVLDAGADRCHPRKRNRPVAAGRISVGCALGLCVSLIVASGLIASWLLPAAFLLFGCLYLLNTVAYCVLLKQRVIADVMSIAMGFVLRLLAGCAAIDVAPTSWILVCGFSLALLLGFGKRRLEVDGLDQATEYRPVLLSYSVDKLNILLAIAASICLLSYMLYTVSPQTVQLHQTDRLVYTIPFVAYGIFRYMFKVQEGQRDGPVDVLLKDPIFAVNGLLWVMAVLAILYLC